MSDELKQDEQRERSLLKGRVNAYFARWHNAQLGDNDRFGDETRRLGEDAHHDLVPNLLKALEAEEAKVIAAHAFKQYVHSSLDAAGVPVDPESPHKAEGCRIGGRLDWLLAKLAAMAAAVAKLPKTAAALAGAGEAGGTEIYHVFEIEDGGETYWWAAQTNEGAAKAHDDYLKSVGCYLASDPKAPTILPGNRNLEIDGVEKTCAVWAEETKSCPVPMVGTTAI